MMRRMHELEISLRSRQPISRRGVLRGMAAGGLAAGALSWAERVKLHANELRREGKACIVLWMQGGPSQFETFDPKPGHANGGETKAIDTSVPGIQLADNLPHLATVADKLSIVRSLSTKEGNHQRATYLLHTSYVPNASVQYPTLGSVVAHQMRDYAGELPSFVRIGRRFANGGAGGILGAEFDPFVVETAARPPANTVPVTPVDRYQRRIGLLDRLQQQPAQAALAESIADHRKLYEQASAMVLSPAMSTFDLQQEPESVRAEYGSGEFAEGCLLARRLVEAGVTFIEVALGGWDTHDNNFERSTALCQQFDQPFAALVRDLERRGMLDKTLVIWLGEFGRTPRINPRAGRDHFPRAFSAALAGCGVRGGQVVGATTEGGDEVADLPISEKDLFRSVHHALGIDADHENMSPIGRPIPVVEGGRAVKELFG